MSESISLSFSSSSSAGARSNDPLKIILLGDHSVGKSKLIERFLSNAHNGACYSTSGVNIYKYGTTIDGKAIEVEFWDPAGRERTIHLHQSYFHQAHACILIFDATHSITYRNLDRWLHDLRSVRPRIPCLCAMNKIDLAIDLIIRSNSFPKRLDMPFYHVSAADGTNIVRLFRDAIRLAHAYRKGDPVDFLDQLMHELKDQRIYEAQTVDSVSHHYENHQTDLNSSSDRSSSCLLRSSPISKCCGKSSRLTKCLTKMLTDREEKKSKFWLNLLLAEEWNYFYLLKEKSQPYEEQEKHIKRLHNASKLSSILEIYLNSFVPHKAPSSFNRTIYLNHYERLQCLFNSLFEVISTKDEGKLCSTILQRIDYLLKKMKECQYEQTFIQYPVHLQRTLILSSNDQYRTLQILSKDKQTIIERLPLYLIIGLNLQQNQHLLVFSVDQSRTSNSVHNYHFAHADPSVIQHWYQLLDKHIKQAKSEYMNKYQEYRI